MRRWVRHRRRITTSARRGVTAVACGSRSMALTMRCAECITAVRSVGGLLHLISESLAKEPVGLVERDDGDWDIHFGPIPLGRIDRKGRFHRPKRKRRRRKPVRG